MDFSAERPREREFARFLAFVDAVTAIAITLLVLPLVDLASGLREGQSVADLIGDHLAQLGGALLSFVVIARLWLAQHQVVRRVVVQDRIVTQLTLLWLVTIVLLPFPTALLPEGGDQALTKVLYIGTIAISMFCLAGMAWRIRRTPSIRDPGDANDVTGTVTAGVTLLLALGISLAIPATGYWPLLLLVIADPVVARFRA